MNHPNTFIEQDELMAKHQGTLRNTLNFICHSVTYWDAGWADGSGNRRDCTTWYNANGDVIAESGWTGINVIREYHAFVWNAFKLFF